MALKDKSDGVSFVRLPKKEVVTCDHCKKDHQYTFSISTVVEDDDPRMPISPTIYFCLGCGYNLAAAIKKACEGTKE